MNDNLNDLTDEIKRLSKNYSKLETVIVFGSVARGQAGKEKGAKT